MKKIGLITSQTLYMLVVLGVLALAFLFVGTKVDLFGYEVKIVKSGSMEPAIMTGGIVVVREAPVYNVGDVITYGQNRRNALSVTHRIIEKQGEGRTTSFVTKGDANEDKDPRAVPLKDVIGKVAFTVPFLGYVIEFARTPLGFFLLIGFPALFIVLDEIANIVWEVRKAAKRERRTTQEPRNTGQKRVRMVPKNPQLRSAVMAKRTYIPRMVESTAFDLKVAPYGKRMT